jgi:hypothetical protein
VRLALFILICLTIAIGGYFSCDPKYKYEPGWYEVHLRIIREDLEDIANHLHRFEKENGRYPTNDEGLLVLEALKAKWSVSLESMHEISFEELKNKYGFTQKEIERKLMGPRLWALRRREAPYQPVSEAGILSPWDIPYVYENRKGLSKDSFADSPATLDTGRNYSLQVDEDIYVYCVGAMIHYEEYVSLIREMYIVRMVTGALIAVFTVLFFVFRPKRASRSRIVTAAKVAGATAAVLGSAFIAWAPNSVTCYIMRYFGEWRRPQMLAKYEELLERYRQRGVISDEAAAKVRKALSEEMKEGE